jgi:hypothetical protein
MRHIKNGKLAKDYVGGHVAFNTPGFLKRIQSRGGTTTLMTVPFSQYSRPSEFLEPFEGFALKHRGLVKGEPPQRTSNSVSACAALITEQPIVIPKLPER